MVTSAPMRTTNEKERLLLWNLSLLLFLFTNVVALLLNTGSLTSELAQIVKLSAANLTYLVDLDALNVGRLDWEDTLYTNGTRHLTYSEALLVTVTCNLDNYTTIELDTLL